MTDSCPLPCIGYVLVDELGMPQRTDWLRRRAYELMDKHKSRRVRLYDARHATLTALAAAGVPARSSRRGRGTATAGNSRCGCT
ncbi:hypothetical protein FHX44_113208 [Pseudonocardia hierapolitana]|uniref:Uncharacterized protein n=1 Tax=Pseudonocardia hierapolitana TaxID=1128676 RepID=A0A561SR00_9PSEU|nr:hypothetical protein [Pseudonocardia hierapolitana]TWF77303.1 hypothetical protein FHX44_113208 [Pseudonocardia hierapolitana]